METKKFKPFDKVLVRSLANPKWSCDFYSHYNVEEDTYDTVSFRAIKPENTIPYEGNEHLVGTSDSPKVMKEEVKLKEGDWVVFLSYTDAIEEKIHFFVEILDKIRKEDFMSKTGNDWQFVIPFKDFDPSNMEETKKHILCVKNGKIVKYKG